MRLNKNLLKFIGNTPLVKINKLVSKEDAEVLAKLEGFNPGGVYKG